MKKLAMALIVGLMVVAGTASLAAAEITVGGEMEVRYDVWKNLTLNDQSGFSETQNFWAQRVLLNVDAKITEGLEAFVEMDTENTEYIWGGQSEDFLGNPNGAGGLTSGLVNDLNHQQSTMRIKQAWINFMVPGLPVGMKIGHQPLALGHGIFLDTHRQGSDAILLYAKPIPQMLLAGVYIKGFDSSPTTQVNAGELFRTNPILTGAPSSVDFVKDSGWNHDADFYAALCNYTWMENNTVGVNFTYVHDNNLLLGNPVTSGNGNDVTAQNIALVADGAISGLNYKLEGDFLHIKASKVFDEVGIFGYSYTVNAWAAMAGLSGKCGPVNVAVEAAYGTGNDNDDANILYDVAGRGIADIHDNNDHAYFTPYGATSYNYAFLYNDKIGQGPLGAGGGFGFGDGFGGFGLANTGYIKLSVGGSPMDRMNCGLDVLALNASAQAMKGQSRYLGTEIDGDVNYKIYDNLLLDVKGGVFIPGSWYEFRGLNTIDPETGASLAANPKIFVDQNDPDSAIRTNTAFGVETKLSVKF